MAEVAREDGLRVAEIEDWQERSFFGTENAWRARPKDDETPKAEQIKKVKQKIGNWSSTRIFYSRRWKRPL